MAFRVNRRASRMSLVTELGNRNFFALFESMGDIRLKFLMSVGRSSRKMLQRDFLSRKSSPSSLMYKGFGKDVRGAYKVKNRILKGTRKIVITSFPLNLFEHGRNFKRRRPDPPRKILKTKFRAKLDGGRLQRFADRATRAIIQSAFTKAER